MSDVGDINEFNKAIIAEFRANGGKVEAFGDAPMVILNTVGAKSGQIREIPLVMLVEGDRRYVIASAAGAPKHPAWYHNLKANPEIEVEIGSDTFTARLEELGEPERSEAYARQEAIMAQFTEYKEKAGDRVIPVFELSAV